MQVILNIDNPQDWTALLPILERLNISIHATLPTVKKKSAQTSRIWRITKPLLQKVGTLPISAMRLNGNENNAKNAIYPF